MYTVYLIINEKFCVLYFFQRFLLLKVKTIPCFVYIVYVHACDMVSYHWLRWILTCSFNNQVCEWGKSQIILNKKKEKCQGSYLHMDFIHFRKILHKHQSTYSTTFNNFSDFFINIINIWTPWYEVLT